MQVQQQDKNFKATQPAYVNALKALFVPYMWSMAVFFSWMLAHIYLEGYQEGRFDYDNPVTIPFIASQYIITVILGIVLLRSAKDSITAYNINTFLQADDD